MDNSPEDKPIKQTRHNYMWRITFPVPENKDVTPRTKLAALLSMLGQYWPTTVLNSQSEDDSAQSLTNGKDL
eukprot:7727209-Ditylum_brightwellii.AAC.1